MRRRAPTRYALLAPATLFALSACVDHPDFLPSQKVKSWESTCDGEAPTCLASCADRTALATASCRDSVWSCAEGIRDDLCCDPVTAPDHCEIWNDECSTQTPCPSGYTCVSARHHPVPADAGLCRLGDLSIPEDLGQCNASGVTSPALIPVLGLSPIKVEGVVNVAVTCEDRKCTIDNPCCQSCTGAYQIELVSEDDGHRLILPIRTASVACAGTNCGFSCSPMQAGRRYTVWGLFFPGYTGGAPGTIHYVGHCTR